MFLQWRLAMPSLERENVRHATLLFCAEGVNVRTTGAGEGQTSHVLEKGWHRKFIGCQGYLSLETAFHLQERRMSLWKLHLELVNG